jgi:hypothetical protein
VQAQGAFYKEIVHTMPDEVVTIEITKDQH